MKKALRFVLLSSAVVGFLTACGGGENKPTTNDHTDTTKTVQATGVSKDFTVDTATSVINWVGTKIGGEHKGTLKVKSGTLKVENGKLVGGKFVLDMTSITVTDLTGEKKADLEGHLKSGDFFEADKHPEGSFEITKVEGNKVDGNLTMKGKANPVSFTAEVTATETGVTATAPAFMINRQQWGISYQSKMKDAPISDDMSVQINLSGK